MTRAVHFARTRAAVTLAVALRAAGTAHAAPPPGSGEAGSVAPLVDRVKGAVVTIQSTKFIRRFAVEDPWTQMMRQQLGLAPPRATRERQEALGSGFVVDRAGIILTNNHVVAGADEVVVKLADNRRFPARVVGSDPPTDVAVVKIDHPPADLQAATLGDSDRVRVGDYVLAIGNPLGLGQTVTMGIVSAKNRVIGERLGDVDPRYEDFIQTDAAINQGNSGGPLFNFRGEVIGINSAIINPGVAMNVGFAIPIDLARQVADQIRKAGRVARGTIGIGAEDFTPERAEEMRTPFVPGALVVSVGRGSPGAAAGLAPGDVVVEMAGKPIDGQRRLLSVVAFCRPGDKVKLVFLRQGRRVETSIGVAGPRSAAEATLLGIELRPLEAHESAALGLSGGGLAVVSVDPRGPASGMLEEGDVLLALDGKPVTLARFKALAARLANGDRAALVIQRGRQRFLLRL
ncbi:MAG TPA: trypsin-like peptidase domain-containing protein [Polyangia bacterium]|nr:trypsin-like peptidase domain-containing protein [Polyangia bacterium]